jgi:hypothetical protein
MIANRRHVRRFAEEFRRNSFLARANGRIKARPLCSEAREKFDKVAIATLSIALRKNDEVIFT